jgi:hypothetical protein
MEIEFVVSIPLRQEDAQNVINAFVSKRPYGAPVPTDKVFDNAGNEIDNPITKENYVEDCIAYFILDVTKNYLIEKVSREANAHAKVNAEVVASDLADWIRNN